MKTLAQQLTKYAAYHRDRRNIATHFAGIPMIVLAATTLLSRPIWLSVAAAAASCLFYFALDRRYGLAMTGVLGISVWIGARLALLPTGQWLAAGIGLFVAGWIIQFIGHAFEGKKPAFVDDLVGLLIGPLFVTAELGFLFGLRDDLRLQIEAKVGPTHRGLSHGGRARQAAVPE